MTIRNPEADGFVLSSDELVTMRNKISCNELFGQIPSDKPLLVAVCEEVDALQQIADRIWESEDSEEEKLEPCDEAQPFNAEGTVAVSNAARKGVWVGLRSPLLLRASGTKRNAMAILLRMEGEDDDVFDAATLIDLGGAGIGE